MSDWKLTRREPRCSACDQEFADGEPLYSRLAVVAAELERSDHCQGCWEARKEEELAAAPADGSARSSEGQGALSGAQSSEAAPTTVIWWRTRHQVGKRGPSMDIESVQALFLALEDAPTQELAELRYLLALILLRKRRLKVVKIVRGEDGEGFLVRRPRRKEKLLVRVYDLDAEKSAQLREVLLKLFEGEDPAELLAQIRVAAESGGLEPVGEAELGAVAQHPASEPRSEPSAEGDESSEELPRADHAEEIASQDV